MNDSQKEDELKAHMYSDNALDTSEVTQRELNGWYLFGFAVSLFHELFLDDY